MNTNAVEEDVEEDLKWSRIGKIFETKLFIINDFHRLFNNIIMKSVIFNNSKRKGIIKGG